MSSLRRRRIRRVLKWGGLGLSLVIVAGWAASLRWCLSYMKVSGPEQNAAGGGQASYKCYCLAIGAFAYMSFEEVDYTPEMGWFVLRSAQRVQWRAYWTTGDSFESVEIPLWMPFLLVAVPTAVLFRRDRRFPPGHCQQCGYNLTGNTSGVCSECGSPAHQGIHL